MNAENKPIHTLPNTTVAFAPATIAPTVCAIVFRVKIAASDWSILSCRSRFSSAACFGRFSFRLSMYDGVTLKRTASATEQTNEKTNARNTKTIRSTTSVFLLSIIDKFALSAPPARAAPAKINSKIRVGILYKFGFDNLMRILMPPCVLIQISRVVTY